MEFHRVAACHDLRLWTGVASAMGECRRLLEAIRRGAAICASLHVGNSCDKMLYKFEGGDLRKVCKVAKKLRENREVQNLDEVIGVLDDEDIEVLLDPLLSPIVSCLLEVDDEEVGLCEGSGVEG